MKPEGTNQKRRIPGSRRSTQSTLLICSRVCVVNVGSPSRGWDVCSYDVNQPSFPTDFYSVLVSISAFMAFSTVFHFRNTPDNSALSHSVLLVLFLLCCSFQLYTSYETLRQPWYNPLWLTELKTPTNWLTLISASTVPHRGRDRFNR